jgi:hypothetical protein
LAKVSYREQNPLSVEAERNVLQDARDKLKGKGLQPFLQRELLKYVRNDLTVGK